MPDSNAGVVQTAVAGAPSIGTRHRSPFLGIISAAPSRLQNAPFRPEPASVSSRAADPAAQLPTPPFVTSSS